MVAVERGTPRHDIGMVSLTGELVKLRMKRNSAHRSQQQGQNAEIKTRVPQGKALRS